MEREDMKAKMCLVCAITGRMKFNTPLCEERLLRKPGRPK
jgi:hypothetical protein